MKKKIYYDNVLRDFLIQEGKQTYVWKVNYPVASNEDGFVLTSIVLKYYEQTGEFETVNTIYVPIQSPVLERIKIVEREEKEFNRLHINRKKL